MVGIVKEGLAYPEAQGVRRMMKMEGQAVVHKEDLEGVHNCQQNLGAHYRGDVQDGCLLMLVVEIQSPWVPRNRVKETMVWQHA